jgi:hypothetical protein
MDHDGRAVLSRRAAGADVGQRMKMRRFRFAAYVMNSTGFLMASLFQRQADRRRRRSAR